MPNTLAHFGVQALGTRAFLPRFDVRWLLLGPVIPDLPWISQRVLWAAGVGLDPYSIRLYAMAQASLLFCLVICAAFALLSKRPLLLFAVLASNSLAHLLLDAVEIKWANGVHLLAPFTWKLFSLRLIWPESPVILALTGLGLVSAVWLCFRARGSPLGLQVHRGRLVAAVALIGLYLSGPVLFMGPALRSDSHFVATLSAGEQRVGRLVEFDRDQVVRNESGAWVRSFAEEEIRIANPEAVVTGTASIQGRFVAAGTVRVDQFHLHTDALRQVPTYAGLLLLIAAGIQPLIRRPRGQTQRWHHE